MPAVDATSRVPEHVPPELVRDFNLYDFPGSTQDIHEAWRRVKEKEPPIFFTPYFGGYWVITRADLLEEAWPDGDLLSSADSTGIPPVPKDWPPFLPIDADDPLHRLLRQPLNIALSPKAVKDLSVTARELAVGLIEELKPRGSCDFVEDFSLRMPMELFLQIVDLPSEDREYLVGLASSATKSPDIPQRQASMQEMFDYLESWIRKRSDVPGTDLMSRIVNMDVGGRALTHDEKIGYMALVMFGGLDTVGGSMALIAKHLAEHPHDRARLRDHPEDIPNAIEEFLRRYSMPTLGRRLTRDATIGEVAMKAGDWVMLPVIAHSVDEHRWPDAMTANLNRCPRDHMAFGKGSHRCPGANLARAEIRIFIDEWLARIPDFAVAEGVAVTYASGGVAGLTTLPLVWPIV